MVLDIEWNRGKEFWITIGTLPNRNFAQFYKKKKTHLVHNIISHFYYNSNFSILFNIIKKLSKKKYILINLYLKAKSLKAK